MEPPPEAAAAHDALKASWATVCEELTDQLAPAAVTILKTTYGVNKPLIYLTESALCTGRNADREAAILRKQLSSYEGVPAVGETLTAYVECVTSLDVLASDPP